MKYKDTRSNEIGGAVFAQDSKHLSLLTQGAMACDNEPCVMLDNRSSSAGVTVAYVYDIGSGSDWKMALTHIPAGQAKIAPSYREWKVAGSELGTFSTPNLTATVTNARYELVRLWVTADNIATLSDGTLQKCDDRKTSSTVIPLKKGENSFLVLTADTSLSIALTTADTNAQGSVYELTEFDRNEITRLY